MKLLPDSEKAVDRKIKAIVKDLGGEYIKLNTQYVSGLPDRMVLLPFGEIRFFELKSKGKKATPIQQYIGLTLRRLDFPWYVIKGGDDEQRVHDMLKGKPFIE